MIFQRMTKLEALAKRVRKSSNNHQGLLVRVLDDEQLLILKDMIESENGRVKTAALKPGKQGYECYVSVRALESQNELPTQLAKPRGIQVPVAWDSGTMQLVVMKDQDEVSWQVGTKHKEEVTVRVRRGPDAPLGEINRLLSLIEKGLF